jgi:hypothetical protein
MGGEELMEDESGLPSDPEQLAMEIEKCESKANKLQEKIALEDAKMDKYRVRTFCTLVLCLVKKKKIFFYCLLMHAFM